VIKTVDRQSLVVRVTVDDIKLRAAKVLGIASHQVVAAIAEWRGVTRQAIHVEWLKARPTTHRSLAILLLCGARDLADPRMMHAAQIPPRIDYDKLKRLYLASQWVLIPKRARYIPYAAPLHATELRLAVSGDDERYQRLLGEITEDRCLLSSGDTPDNEERRAYVSGLLKERRARQKPARDARRAAERAQREAVNTNDTTEES
jgi:hypothetical protein